VPGFRRMAGGPIATDPALSQASASLIGTWLGRFGLAPIESKQHLVSLIRTPCTS
jgi:hypothetical protein